MVSYQFVKQIFLPQLEKELKSASFGSLYRYIIALGTNVEIFFVQALSEAEQTELNTVVTNHGGMTLAQQIGIYLDRHVFPFVTTLIRDYAAENISLGITQAGKTGDVLGLFSKGYDIYANGKPVSVKNAFDTGSLYVAIDTIQYVRNNPSEYAGLSPFVTDARLLKMKNEIEAFLGIPLTP